jgi:hypothetical protein
MPLIQTFKLRAPMAVRKSLQLIKPSSQPCKSLDLVFCLASNARYLQYNTVNHPQYSQSSTVQSNHPKYSPPSSTIQSTIHNTVHHPQYRPPSNTILFTLGTIQSTIQYNTVHNTFHTSGAADVRVWRDRRCVQSP